MQQRHTYNPDWLELTPEETARVERDLMIEQTVNEQAAFWRDIQIELGTIERQLEARGITSLQFSHIPCGLFFTEYGEVASSSAFITFARDAYPRKLLR